jgi:hypothetical protein
MARPRKKEVLFQNSAFSALGVHKVIRTYRSRKRTRTMTMTMTRTQVYAPDPGCVYAPTARVNATVFKAYEVIT